MGILSELEEMSILTPLLTEKHAYIFQSCPLSFNKNSIEILTQMKKHWRITFGEITNFCIQHKRWCLWEDQQMNMIINYLSDVSLVSRGSEPNILRN